MLPWTARLVEALFPRMRPMADFSETQCMSLQTAIVTRLSVLETVARGTMPRPSATPSSSSYS